MSVLRRPAIVSLLLILVALSSACGPSDPRQAVLEERGRWNVELLSWAAADDGSMILSLRVSGPFNASLDRLTVRVELLDAAGAVLDSEWMPIDLSDVQRGGPKDVILRLPARELAGEVEGISIDTVVDPTPEQAEHLEELDF